MATAEPLPVLVERLAYDSSGTCVDGWTAVENLHVTLNDARDRVLICSVDGRVHLDEPIPPNVLAHPWAFRSWVEIVADARGCALRENSGTRAVLDELSSQIAQGLDALQLPQPPQAQRSTSTESGSQLVAKLRDLGSELRTGVPEPDWLVEGLLARGAMTYVGGYIGVGKTPLTLRAIAHLLRGEHFIGFRVRALPASFKVVYLTQEAAPTFLPAAAEAGLDEALVSDRFRVGYFHDFAIHDFAETVQAATRWLDGHGLLVVDTALDWSRATDEDDSATMTAAFQPLVEAVGNGIAVWANGHTIKSIDGVRDSDADIRQIRGSGAVVSNASIVLVYKKAVPRLSGDARALKLVRTRLKYDGPTTRYTLMESGALRTLEPVEAGVREWSSSQQRLLDALSDEWSRQAEVRDAARLSGSMWENVTATLVDRGKIERRGDGKRGSPYEWRLKP